MTIEGAITLCATLKCATRSISEPKARLIHVRAVMPAFGACSGMIRAETCLESGVDRVSGVTSFDLGSVTMIEYSQLARACRWAATTSRVDAERHVEHSAQRRPSRTVLSQFCDVPGAAFCLKHESQVGSREAGVSIGLFVPTDFAGDLAWRRFGLRAVASDILAFAAELDEMYEALDQRSLARSTESTTEGGA